LPADSTTYLLATRSRDKVREIGEILGSRSNALLITLDEAGIAPSAEEDGVECWDTFTANAIAKAEHFSQRTGLPVIADDSGLCVDALHGAPGVHSKRFAAATGLTGLALDQANNEKLIASLAGVPAEARVARYMCAAVLVRAGRPHAVAIGTVRGTILQAPRGTAGFGYDPLFLVPDPGRTFGEMDGDAKHALSHRGRAFRAMASLIG
jgi:XTP/dITP diphosphohydrolase